MPDVPKRRVRVHPQIFYPGIPKYVPNVPLHSLQAHHISRTPPEPNLLCNFQTKSLRTQNYQHTPLPRTVKREKYNHSKHFLSMNLHTTSVRCPKPFSRPTSRRGTLHLVGFSGQERNIMSNVLEVRPVYQRGAGQPPPFKFWHCCALYIDLFRDSPHLGLTIYSTRATPCALCVPE